MEGRGLIAGVLAASGLVLALAVLVSALLWDRRVVYGVLLGGLLSMANFWVLGWTVRRLLLVGSGSRARFVLLFLLKLGLVFGLFALALAWSSVHILGVFLGCSVVVVAILLVAPLSGSGRSREGEEDGGN